MGYAMRARKVITAERVSVNQTKPTISRIVAPAQALSQPVVWGFPNSYNSPSMAMIRPGNVTLSPEEALYISQHCVHPIQDEVRPLDSVAAKTHIDVLAAIMADDAWLEGTQIRFAVLNGRVYVIDGNHRMPAQAKIGKSIRWNIAIDRCQSEEELRTLFRRFNTNTRVRTEHQILGANGFAKTACVTQHVAKAVFNAMPFITNGFKTSKAEYDSVKNRIADLRLTAAGKYLVEARIYDKCIKGAASPIKKKLLSAGVTAVALVTLKHHPDKATEFWTAVARNDGLRAGDPRNTLVSDLLTRNMNVGPAHQNTAIPAAGWNAWFENRKVKFFRCPQVEAIRIAGTPYLGA